MFFASDVRVLSPIRNGLLKTPPRFAPLYS
jgi:hypothetical protein